MSRLMILLDDSVLAACGVQAPHAVPSIRRLVEDVLILKGAA